MVGGMLTQVGCLFDQLPDPFGGNICLVFILFSCILSEIQACSCDVLPLGSMDASMEQCYLGVPD